MKKSTTLLITILLTFGLFAQKTTKTWKVSNLSINNSHSNSAASYYGDNKIVFSSSKGNRLHLYVGDIINNDVKNMSPFIEAKTHETSATFADNENTLYFTRSVYGEENSVKYSKNKKKTIAIFKATKNGNGSWGNITPMPFNSSKYDVGHPALGPNKRKLYFSSNMPGSVGRSDIYVVDILGNNKYSTPKNLGKTINTKGNELYPFVDKNNKLHFASNGHNSKGGLDIFAISLNGNDKVYHYPKPINSKYDDFSYVYNYNTEQGFLTSNRPGGKGEDDIYIFYQTEKEVEEKTKTEGCTQKLIGTVYLNATQKKIPNATVLLKDTNGSILKTITTDDSASFSFEVKCKTIYKIEVSKDGYKTSERLMSTNGQNGVVAVKNIFLIEGNGLEGDAIKKDYIGAIDFEYNKTNLLPRFTYELDKAIQKMMKNEKIKIHFESHTDSRAETDFNMELSKERIEVLKEYLGFKGIYRGRVSGDAFGETKPLNRCTKEVECTENEYLINRRTTFVLTEDK